MSSAPLILASASPRRQQLLREAGIDFTITISGIDEAAFATGAPRAIALKTALAKADAVARNLSAAASSETIILSADTIVVVDDEIFGKPRDRAEARTMLERLSGRSHTVMTGLALQRARGETLVDVAAARVTFNALTPEFISDYLASGEADDKAGAYGIQGLGARLVAAVEGDLTGVIGLPLGLLEQMYGKLTGARLFTTQSPRAVARAAFEELKHLPPQCLEGIPG